MGCLSVSCYSCLFIMLVCQALLSYDRPEDLYQSIGILYAVFHHDVDNLTLSLLNITLPGLLLQSLSTSSGSVLGIGGGRAPAATKFLNDPRGGALAKLCVLAINLMCTARRFASGSGWLWWLFKFHFQLLICVR